MEDFSLKYLLKPAKNTNQPAPALFMIHGYGSNEADLFSFATALPDEYAIFSLQAPYALPEFGYAWYSIDLSSERWFDVVQAKTSVNQILEFIEKACQVYNLNSEKISLLGFSQGCILSLAIGLSFPSKIHKIIGLSGYLEEKLLDKLYTKNDFSNLEIYLSHGVSDQVIPFEWAEESYKKIKKIGISCIYEKYPTGHTVSPQNFYSFRDWLIQKSK